MKANQRLFSELHPNVAIGFSCIVVVLVSLVMNPFLLYSNSVTVVSTPIFLSPV
ncbi:hypothetical protein LCGC14_1780280 [marine sediment metagenome]|uniref:Uncharacterized protein n=1 Tax=marine sediment metagenome TaxID=412755 RepID=A0A0F9JAJ7_9ZZZZ